MEQHAAFIITLLLGGAFIAFHFYSRRKTRLLTQRIAKIQSEHSTELLKIKLDTREQTLQEISRDIHDNIALGLTLSKLHLHTISYSATSDFHQKIELSINLIQEAIHNLSDISKSLNADAIRQYGLISAIENEIAIVQQTKVFQIDFELNGIPKRLGPLIEIALFRIVQEALNNIIKHSDARDIHIMVSFESNEVKLMIQDNGRGFEIEDPKNFKGAGLKNIRQRAEMIASNFSIESIPGTGTKINVILPLKITNEKRPTYHEQ